MKKLLTTILASILFPCIHAQNPFILGTDMGWLTEYESLGWQARDINGNPRECMSLMADYGINAQRIRVWVDPSAHGNWCDKNDVLTKCQRAQALGQQIMIDFHYSDSWADPQKQPVPAAWQGHDADRLSGDVFDHTLDVLTYLKDNGIDVTWVQVGNEVTNGMLWETCRVKGQDAANFVKCFNAGYSAVRRVYPDAAVILHVDNGWKMETLEWYFDLMRESGANYDMIGLSLYPSYWEAGAYPDWHDKTQKLVSNVPVLAERYGKPVMLCEMGMPAAQPEESKAAFQYVLDSLGSKECFKGIFLWEPESEKSNAFYDYGSFRNGRPTVALDPFK